MRNSWKFLLKFWQHFTFTGCNYRAGSLAFTTLLSLVPLMTISVAILAIFPVFQQISGHIQDFIFRNFVPTTGDVVQSYLSNFVQKAGKLSAIGLIFLVITAIAMMVTMEDTFNQIWQIYHRRPLWKALALYVAILIVSPLLLGIGFFISSYLASVHFLTSAANILGLSKPLLALMPFVLSVLAFTLIYLAVPYGRVPVRAALIGGFWASVFFEAAKQLFTLYVTRFAAYELLYGALASIPVFLIWVYLCWLITLAGAVISYLLAKNH